MMLLCVGGPMHGLVKEPGTKAEVAAASAITLDPADPGNVFATPDVRTYVAMPQHGLQFWPDDELEDVGAFLLLWSDARKASWRRGVAPPPLGIFIGPIA